MLTKKALKRLKEASKPFSGRYPFLYPHTSVNRCDLKSLIEAYERKKESEHADKSSSRD